MQSQYKQRIQELNAQGRYTGVKLVNDELVLTYNHLEMLEENTHLKFVGIYDTFEDWYNYKITLSRVDYRLFDAFNREDLKVYVYEHKWPSKTRG